MFRRSLRKLWSDPCGFAKQAINKLVFDRIKYGRGGDYDAARYWRDRLGRHRDDLRGVGDEGLSEAANEDEYRIAAATFSRACGVLERPAASSRALEIGPGTGFYTELLFDLGVSSYVGIDITDVQFPQLRSRYPEAEFRRGDVTTDPIEGEFDLIVMIDVIEHIVAEAKLASCLRSIDAALAPGGSFVVAPLTERSRRHLFHVRYWSVDDVERRLEGYSVTTAEEFRDGRLVVFAKPKP